MADDRRRVRHVLIPLLITCFLLAVIEILSRAYLHAHPQLETSAIPIATEGTIVSDMVLNHKWMPGLNVRMPSRGAICEIITNQESWLERYEVQKAKPANVFRMFYLGDSTTQGVSLWPESMVNVLETMLNEHYAGHPEIEIVNTGTSSYSTLLYYLLVRHKVLAYSPDVVVIDFDMTDVSNDAIYRKRVVTDEDGLPVAVQPFEREGGSRLVMGPEGAVKIPITYAWHRFFFRHLGFYRLVTALLPQPTWRARAGWLPWHVTSDESANWLAHDWTPEIRANVDYSMRILAETVALLRRHGVQVVVTGVPHYPQYTGEWSSRPHEVLRETAVRAGAFYMDSYGPMAEKIRGTRVEEFYWSTDPTHFNAAGNRMWAEEQYKFLLAHKGVLLPRDGH